jgi:hypothetical protein
MTNPIMLPSLSFRGAAKSAFRLAGEPGIYNPRRWLVSSVRRNRVASGHGFRAPLAALAAPE